MRFRSTARQGIKSLVMARHRHGTAHPNRSGDNGVSRFYRQRDALSDRRGHATKRCSRAETPELGWPVVGLRPLGTAGHRTLER
jgi:hypothetical protein